MQRSVSGNLGKLSNDEWAVGLIAVAAILLNLLGLLLTTNSAISCDRQLHFAVLEVVVHPIRWVIVGILTLATAVMMSFYYWYQ